MKSVGIFICNYNKREYVVNCVKSLLEQNFEDYDLYVVDNASTDDSVEKLKEIYGEKITLIVNSENLGGSGGFNTGIKLGYKNGYKYIMLVDNDTVFDKDAVGELYKFLETNDDVGMAGAKIYQMQNPEYIQDFGGKLCWDIYNWKGINSWEKNDIKLPEVQDADYLAACALMVKRKVIDIIGFMDESCFIYGDDIEWGHKCRLNGYRCCAVGKAKVWHNQTLTSISSKSLGFSKYYYIRNSAYFFAKYIQEYDIDNFAEIFLAKIYKFIVGYYSKKQYDMLPIVMYALTDFINNVRGRAPQHKIERSSNNLEPFKEIITTNKKILIKISSKLLVNNTNKKSALIKFVNKCKEINPDLIIYVYNEEWSDKEILELKNELGVLSNSEDSFDCTFYLCEHILDEKECILPTICVDEYLNCVYDKEIYEIYRNMDVNEKIFVETYKKLFITTVKNIRKNRRKI